MSSSPGSPTPSPFAARASTRAPMATSTPANTATAVRAAQPAVAPKKSGGGAVLVVAALVLLSLAGAGVWWVNRPSEATTRERSAVAPAPASVAVAPAPAEKPSTPAEKPAAKAARLAKAFAAVQAIAVTLELDVATRATLAEGTVLAAQAQSRMDGGDLGGAAAIWEKALATAGPVVLARVTALYEAEAAGLRDVRLDDQSARDAQALARARDAVGAAESRGDWAEAIAKRQEARGLIAPAKKAVAAQLAEMATGAAGRGDDAMATLFHERALRLDGGLEASRAHLYRHKFKAAQIIRSPGGLELAYAPPAELMRGSASGEAGRDADETLQRVTLTKGFFIAVNETTQREWDRVMGGGAALRTLRAARAKPETISPDLPMHSITWEQAAEYCRKLSALEGMAFRLPTEAEWEYACRAGTTTAFNLAVDGISAREANIDDGTAAAPLAPRAPGVSGRANAWGLRDMHGNVWEWCADWSAPYPTAAAALRDPAGPTGQQIGRLDLAMKAVRGGGWNSPANDARSANRWEYAPDVATSYIGLRVAHDPELTKP